MNLTARMVGVAYAVPAKKVTNFDLEAVMDTTDQWISERTGIKARHIADEKSWTLDLAMESVRKTLERTPHIDPKDLDAIIIGTSTSDYIFPSLACEVARELGLSCLAFDLQAACCGFVYAVDVAAAYIRSGQAKRILVVGVELISRVLDWSDRKTAVLFGDGAGSCILEAGESGLIISKLKTIADKDRILCAKNTAIHPDMSGRIAMDGQKVFKHAVGAFVELMNELTSHNNVSPESITKVVPHQANQRILDAVMDRAPIDKSKFFSCVADFGNTSSASIPIALSLAFDPDSDKKERVLVMAFGGGLTAGGFVMDYIPSGKW